MSVNLGIYMNAKRGYTGSGALSQYAVRNLEQLLRLNSRIKLSNLNVVVRLARDELRHKRSIADGMDSISQVHWLGTRQFDPLSLQESQIEGAVGYRVIDPYSRMLTATALKEFILHLRSRDKAAPNVLGLWGHADGPRGILFSLTNAYDRASISGDEYQRDILSPSEVSIALAESGCAEQKLSLICLDSCQSACLEFASVFAPYAKYMIASQTAVPGSGWDYGAWPLILNEMKENTWSTTASQITDDFARHHPTNTTISVVDLEKIENVIVSLREVTNILLDDDTLRKLLYEVRKNIRTVDNNRSGLVDAGLLFDTLASKLENSVKNKCLEFVTNLRTAIPKSVVSKDLQGYGLTGCSIFFPTEDIGYGNPWTEITNRIYFENDNQLSMFKRSGWHKFLKLLQP